MRLVAPTGCVHLYTLLYMMTFTIRHISGSCPATAAAILRSAAMQLKEMRSAWRMLRWAGLRASRNASVGSAEDLHCNLPIRYARPCEGRAHIIQRLSVLMGPGADLDYPQMYSKPTATISRMSSNTTETAMPISMPYLQVEVKVTIRGMPYRMMTRQGGLAALGPRR